MKISRWPSIHSPGVSVLNTPTAIPPTKAGFLPRYVRLATTAPALVQVFLDTDTPDPFNDGFFVIPCDALLVNVAGANRLQAVIPGVVFASPLEDRMIANAPSIHAPSTNVTVGTSEVEIPTPKAKGGFFARFVRIAHQAQGESVQVLPGPAAEVDASKGALVPYEEPLIMNVAGAPQLTLIGSTAGIQVSVSPLEDRQ